MIGSDLFFDPSVFEPLLVTVKWLLSNNQVSGFDLLARICFDLLARICFDPLARICFDPLARAASSW